MHALMKNRGIALLFVTSLIVGCVTPTQITGMGRSLKMKSWSDQELHYQDMMNRGKYSELIEEYKGAIQKAEKDGNVPQQIEKSLRVSNIYNQNLKNYSQAIEYAERALNWIEEGERLGPEKYPDEYFYPEINEDAKEIFGGDEWARKIKSDWYQRQKSTVYGYLWAQYKSIGDAGTAEMYRRKAMKEIKPAEEVQKEVMEKQKAAERTKSINDLLARMEEQAARNDQSGLRESISVYIRTSFAEYYDAPEGTAQWAAIGVIKFPMAADISYRYGLYQDALEYSLNGIAAMKAFLEQGRQIAKQALFESDARRIMEQREGGVSVGYIRCQLIAGSSLSRLGRYGEAIPRLREAYERREAGAGVLWGVSAPLSTQEELPKMEALYELTRAYEQAGMNAEAVKACGEMIGYFEGVRARLTRETHKVSFMGKQREIYDRMIHLLLKEGRAGEALAYAERARSRAFLDLLAGKELKAKDPRTQGLLAERKAAEAEFTRLDEKTVGPSRERSVLIVKKMDGISHEIEQRDTELASLTAVKTLSVKEIQAMLDQDTALIEYHVTREGMAVWVVASDTVSVHRIEIPISVLAQKIIQLRGHVEDPGGRLEGRKNVRAVSRVRLEIAPKRFRHGEEIAYRVYVKNNLPLFLSIDEVETTSGNRTHVTRDLLEKEIPGGEEKTVYGYSVKWKIPPGIHRVLVRTDQGDLVSNTVEVLVDGHNMATVVDRGDTGDASRIAEQVEQYSRLSLHDILIKPIVSSLKGKRRVGIIPHGVLHYVPFAALTDGRRYLMEDYTLFYLPSATVLKFCRDKWKAFTGGILAMGDPDLRDKDLEIPFAVAEVKAIKSLYPGSTALIGKEATKRTFTSRCGAYNAIHLASHGVFDPNRPLNSALLLSPEGLDNGRLTAGDIFDLELNASLVTLSACQSGMSRVRAGDEMMGIPRAFMYAGTPTVVASLWNVNDEATALMMGRFYEGLKTLEKAESLRRAQMYLRQDKKYEAPYYWAAFSLTGDYR